jgi:hypothetical protein
VAKLGGLSIIVMDFVARNSQNLNTSRAGGHSHGEESTCQARVQIYSLEQIPLTWSAFSSNSVNSPFVIVQ